MARQAKVFNKYRKNSKKITKKEKIANFEKIWCNFFYQLNENENKNSIIIPKASLNDYFKKEDIIFQNNVIHIIQGSNGQGKSSLLKNIANSNMMDSFLDIKNQGILGKRGSNNIEINKILNTHEYSYFNFINEEKRKKILSDKISNLKNNFTYYVDFTIDFFKKDTSIFCDINTINNMFLKPSGGEYKIQSINSLFMILKVLQKLKKENFQNKINIVVCLDEPDNGLSYDIQLEFQRRLKYYIKRMPENVYLTYFIVSHSFVWKKEKDVLIHNILDFKKDNQKKIHKNVFI